MSGERFINAWLSKDNERERIKADMYLLGIMDATEGTVWCGYQQVLPGSLREDIYSSFKKLSAQSKKKRAATLIQSALAQAHPCQSGVNK